MTTTYKTTDFHAGGKLRYIGKPRVDLTPGKEYPIFAVDHINQDVHFTDDDARGRARNPRYGDIEPVVLFDATKLRAGDRVLIEVEVSQDGLSTNGNTITVGAGHRVHLYAVHSYAPGYTPAPPEPISDEWARAYAEAYPDRVREYVASKLAAQK